MRPGPLKDGNTTQSLLWLLQNNQVAKWEITYRAAQYEARTSLKPDELASLYTHRLSFRELEYSTKEVKKLMEVLPRSRFSPSSHYLTVRLNMRFYNYGGKVVFDLFTAGPFTAGTVNGQSASFEGDLPAYLKGFVAQYFE